MLVGVVDLIGCQKAFTHCNRAEACGEVKLEVQLDASPLCAKHLLTVAPIRRETSCLLLSSDMLIWILC